MKRNVVLVSLLVAISLILAACGAGSAANHLEAVKKAGVILPQALRLVIPAWSNEPVSLLKSTGVVFLIAVPELMAKAKAIASRTYDPIGSYLAVAVVYLAMVYILDAILRWIERASRIPGFDTEGKKA